MEQKEQKEEKELYGVCRFCKQSRIVRPKGDMKDLTIEDLDALATAECDCKGARQNRQEKNAYDNAHNNCDTVAFMAFKRGIIEEEEVFDMAKLLKECVNELAVEVVDSVTVKRGNWKVKISRSVDKFKFNQTTTRTEKDEF